MTHIRLQTQPYILARWLLLLKLKALKERTDKTVHFKGNALTQQTQKMNPTVAANVTRGPEFIPREVEARSTWSCVGERGWCCGGAWWCVVCDV